MSEELFQLCARRDELLAIFEKRRQCSGRVLDCQSADALVKIPNKFRVDLYGPWTFCKFCERCLRKSPGVSIPKEQQAAATVYDPAWVDGVRAERKLETAEYSAAIHRISELEKAERDQGFWDRYDAHIASEEWREKRRAVIRRCGNVCEGCGAAPVAHVHHLSYEHLGDELLFELVGICVECHAKCHPERFQTEEVF